MTISFVIPCYNHWHLTHQLLFDIHSHCKGVDEVIVINNGSTEEEVGQGLGWWMDSKLLPLRVKRLADNVGFVRGSNYGLRSVTQDIGVLISNDVRIRGPLHEIAKATLGLFSKIILGGKVYRSDTGWNTFDGRTFPYVEGWLLAAHTSTWKGLGYLDERYAPHDFEDVDFSTGAIQAGYEIVEFPAGLVEHLTAQTLGYNPEREIITRSNQEKFRQKWLP